MQLQSGTEIDWGSKEAGAALKMIMDLKIKSCLTEFQLAELIMLAPWSFWYTQIRLSDKGGAAQLKALIDSGYNPEADTWWHIETVFPVLEERIKALRQIAVFMALKLAEKDLTTNIISNGFPLVARILFGAQYRRVLALALLRPTAFDDLIRGLYEKSAPKDESYWIRPCINPFCGHVVDLRKKKTGACCREHVNYRCIHPKCVAAAAKTPWGYKTHVYNSKIGKEHLDWRQRGPQDPNNHKEAK